MGTSVSPTCVFTETVWICTKPMPAAVTTDTRANTASSVSLCVSLCLSGFGSFGRRDSVHGGRGRSRLVFLHEAWDVFFVGEGFVIESRLML